MTVMTRADFARHQGWNKSYITRLAQAGRLVLTAEGRVDVEASVKRIAATADPARQDVAERHQAAREAREEVPEASDMPKEPDAGASASYQSSRATKEHYSALQAQLEYERASGKLVEASEVRRAATELGTLLRQALERIADVLTPEVTPESDPDRVHAIIQTAADNVLRDVADRCESMVGRMGQPS